MAIFDMKPAVSLMLLKLLLLVLGLLSTAPLITTGNDNHQQFIFSSGFTNASLILDGTASVTPSGLLELTNGTAMSMGHAFYPSPLRFRDDSPNSTVQSFSTSFVFGIISIYDLSSHGITLLVAPSKNLLSATPVQYLGLFNGSNNGNLTNHIFAVELDTWQNSEFRDINNNHIGVDINGLTSKDSRPAGFFHDQNGTFKNLTLSSQEAMQVWVEYDREKTQIDVTLAPLAMAKPRKPTVSSIQNLSDVLTDVAYIGFSSSTGKINTHHYVLGWSFAMNGPAPSIDVTVLPKLPRHHSKGRRSWVLDVVLPMETAALLLSLGTITFFLMRRHFRYAEVRDDWESEFGPHRFSYKDLFHATGGFENKNLLGVGGFGRVYKGVLPRSRLKIAVKRVSHDSKQGMKEFIAEIVSIGRLQNRNLVQLLGYCRRKGELLLVYEYMPNGSLDKYLHNVNEEDNSVLNWSQRFRIIKGIASGLLYLHEEWEKVVVHRDIKASNVLLDDEMNGRLGDFGLARLYDHGVDPQTTHVVGTIGYLAPELARSGNATTPTDVFAFGMFVLEVTCGQRPVNHQNTQDGQLILVDWVLDKVQKGSFTDTVDARLKGRYDVGEAYLALKIGLLCSHPFANARPTMRQVMQYFDGEIQPPDLSFEVLSCMQSEGFDPYVILNQLSSTSIGTMSHASGGR